MQWVFYQLLSRSLGVQKLLTSAANEKHHKDFVKANAKLTQRISSLFAAQLSRNDHDHVVIDRLYDYIKPYCSQDHPPKPDVNVTSDDAGQHWSDSESDAEDDDDISCDDHDDSSPQDNVAVRGQYTLSINVNAQKRVTCTHRWHNYERRLLLVFLQTHL
jgi:hypothetical protein